MHKFNFEKGEILLIDKPYKWTSFDVIRQLKKELDIKKIGHAGTLDPLATGLLILCTGKGTKQIQKFQNLDKEYTGTMVLGKTTPSIDAETDFDNEYDISHVTIEYIFKTSEKFKGNIEQVPPMYSAISKNGQRMYNKARKGETEELAARQVFVNEFEITNIELPKINFRITCSKGTYIRSIVRDFGNLINTGAYLSTLRRTRIGNYNVKEAYTPYQLIDKAIIEN